MNDQRLSDELHSRAAGLTGLHPVGLDDVKHRAKGIRRRRRAASGLAVAAVLAVAVPFGLSLDGTGTTRPQPPVATQRPDGSTDGGRGEPDRRGVLTNDVDATSGAPRIPYLLDGEVVTTDGEQVPLGGSPRSFAPLGDGWVTVDPATGEVRFFDADGSLERAEESTGTIAGSADGTVVAWATPDGRVFTESAEGGELELAGPDGGAEGIQPVAVIGSGSCGAGEECTVYFQTNGEQQAPYLTSTDGLTTRLEGLSIEDAGADGTMTGVVSVTDDGSCSSLSVRPEGERWRTCDHTLGRISADGRYVIGKPAYLDGLGDTSLSILDAADGSVVAEWSATEETQAFVNTAVWDADGTVLATVYEKGSWALMRMSPDGGLTTVLGLEGGDESSPPLVLPVAP